MIKKEIKNEFDFLIAQAQTETDIAKEVVESIRKKEAKTKEEVASKYYEEKVALKMLDFFKEEEKIITLYVEAKLEYPIIADLIENKRPYLKNALIEAKKLYERMKGENNMN